MQQHINPAALPGEGKAALYIRQATPTQTVMGSDLGQLPTQRLITFAHEKGFTDENLVVFNDSGLPATAALEKREGMRELISAIEHDAVKAVFIRSEYSLYRDARLADMLFFVLLCQQHNVVVITPDMVYDFSNVLHGKLFQFRLEGASFVLSAKALRNRTRQQLGQQKRGNQ